MGFLDLHVPGTPLLLPNAWDVGSARLLESLGARAVATTSSGFAATLGKADGQVTLEEALEHSRALSAGVGIPVSADFENGYGDPAVTLALAAATGLAGASIEDWSGTQVYPVAEAADRVRAARQAAPELVLIGRAEGYPLIMLTPDNGGIRVCGFYAETPAEFLQESWAVLRRRFREGPHDEFGPVEQVTLASTAAEPFGILIDGEKAETAGQEVFRLVPCPVDLLATHSDGR